MRFIPHKVENCNEQAFSMDKGPVGCLLIHGFTGMPSEMLLLGEFLAERDITVRGVRLPGHGTLPDDMDKTNWHDWAGKAEAEFLALREKCDEVFVAGLSMGGALTLYLAEKYDLPGAAALAAPAFIDDWRVKYLLPILGPFVKFYPAETRTDFADPEAAKTHRSYEYIPISSVRNILELVKEVRENLDKIKCPLLVVHSPKDETVMLRNAKYIMDHVSSEKKEYLQLEKSGHIVTKDIEKNIVFEKIYELIKRESKILN